MRFHHSIGEHSWNLGGMLDSRIAHMHIDFGYLCDHIISSLLKVPMAVLPAHVNLVHVAAPRKKWSVGILPFLPTELLPLDTLLSFTFAINGKVHSKDIPFPARRPLRFQRKRRNIVQWEMRWFKAREDTATRFVTIICRALDLQPAGVTNAITFRTLKYMYEAIGLVSSNLMRFRGRFNYDQDTYENYDMFYRGIDLQGLEQFASNPLNTMVRQTPFNFWLFNRNLWMRFPNFVIPQSLSQYTVYYYLKHVHHHAKDVLPKYRSNLRRICGKKLGLLKSDTGLMGVIMDSVENGQYTHINGESWEEIDGKKAAALPLAPFESSKGLDLQMEIWEKLWH